MNARTETAVARVLLSMGRQSGVAPAVARLSALLLEVEASGNADRATLIGLRGRARAALAATSELAATAPTVKVEHDALAQGLAALEQRLGDLPEFGGHRQRAHPDPVYVTPLSDPPPRIESGNEETATRRPDDVYVTPLSDPPPRIESGNEETATRRPDDVYVTPLSDPPPRIESGNEQTATRRPDDVYVTPLTAPPPRIESGNEETATRRPDDVYITPLTERPPRDESGREDTVTHAAERQDVPQDGVYLSPMTNTPPRSEPEARSTGEVTRRYTAEQAERLAALHAGETAEEAAARADALDRKIARNLVDNGALLPATEREGYVAEFESARLEPDAKVRAGLLAELNTRVGSAVDAKLAQISALIAGFERLEPLAARALKLLAANPSRKTEHDEFALRWEALRKNLKDPDCGIGDARKALDAVATEARAILAGIGLDEKKAVLRQDLGDDAVSGLEIGSELGAGHFGRVVELGQDKDGKPLVGKAVKTGDGVDPVVATEAFRREIEHEEAMYAKVGEHPNIARCHGIHTVDGEPVLVMEKIEGPQLESVFRDLEERYLEGKIGREEYLGAVQQFVKGVLQGLAQFEAQGLAHRDIKADNIMLDTTTMQPKIVDMGLVQDQGTKGHTAAMLLSRPTESLQDGGKVNEKWDTFAVGKMIFPVLELDPQAHDLNARKPKEDDPNALDPTEEEKMLPHYQFMPGMDGAQEATLQKGVFAPTSTDLRGMFTSEGAKAVTVKQDGSVVAKVGADGEYVGQALHPTSNAQARPGEFAVETAYVDFMNRLTHPDPKQRMSPSEALEHPFLTQQLGDPDKLRQVVGMTDEPEKRGGTEVERELPPGTIVYGSEPRQDGTGGISIDRAPPQQRATVGNYDDVTPQEEPPQEEQPHGAKSGSYVDVTNQQQGGTEGAYIDVEPQPPDETVGTSSDRMPQHQGGMEGAYIDLEPQPPDETIGTSSDRDDKHN